MRAANARSGPQRRGWKAGWAAQPVPLRYQGDLRGWGRPVMGETGDVAKDLRDVISRNPAPALLRASCWLKKQMWSRGSRAPESHPHEENLGRRLRPSERCACVVRVLAPASDVGDRSQVPLIRLLSDLL